MSEPQLVSVRGPRTVILSRTTRASARSAALWGLVFGIMVASSAISYAKIYDTAAKRAQLALLFGANHATSALFGPGNRLDTVAGFTAYKVSMTLWITGAIWGLLLATRLLRGEEEAGRSDLSLVGRSSLTEATGQSLGGMAVGVLGLWALTALVTALTGRSSTVGFSLTASMYFALVLVAPAAVFIAVGALTSQLFSSRRRASSMAALVLGVAYALRMVADSSGPLEWLRWLSPLGWVEQLSPLGAPSPLALVPLGATTLLVGLASVLLAGRRDVGAGLLADRSSAPARTRLLRSPLGLSTRLLRGGILSWWGAVAIAALLMGFVARAAGEVISGGSLAEVMARFGAGGSGAKSYLGLAFLIIAVLVAFLACSQVVAMRAEEAEGRVEPLLSAPVDRLRWAGGRVLIAAAAVLAAGLLAGLAAWLGTVLQGGGLSFGELLAAGVNTVAPALCLLGLSLAAFGLAPRRTALVAWGLVAWSLMVELVGGIGAISSSLVGSSVFHHMAPAPATSPDWLAAGVLVLLGCLGAGLGLVAFQRRDLIGS